MNPLAQRGVPEVHSDNVVQKSRGKVVSQSTLNTDRKCGVSVWLFAIIQIIIYIKIIVTITTRRFQIVKKITNSNSDKEINDKSHLSNAERLERRFQPHNEAVHRRATIVSTKITDFALSWNSSFDIQIPESH